MKKVILLVVLILVFTGCTNTNTQNIIDDYIEKRNNGKH